MQNSETFNHNAQSQKDKSVLCMTRVVLAKSLILCVSATMEGNGDLYLQQCEP